MNERIGGKELVEFLNALPAGADADYPSLQDTHPNVKQWYVRTNTVRRASGKIYGCFAETFSEACDETRERSFEVGSILYVDAPGKCSNGQALNLYTIS
ncbi:MAG: hypothetical protein WKF34_07320 [Pyrinomonadaceae bacterium]